MEFEEILKKRIRGMAVRILACIEHTLQADLDGVDDNESFALRGSDLKIIRGEILNAAGDTTRSLSTLGTESYSAKISLSHETITCLQRAELRVLEFDDVSIPIASIKGNVDTLNKIRTMINAGIVYNNIYYCVGLDDVVNRLLPFLDTAQLAGVRIADGTYREWRNSVSEMYTEGLNG